MKKTFKKDFPLLIMLLVIPSFLLIKKDVLAEGGPEFRPFITEWIVGGGNSLDVCLYRNEKYKDQYDYTVNWGDGTTENNSSPEAHCHTYSTAGTYEVSITGDFPAFNLSGVIFEEPTYDEYQGFIFGNEESLDTDNIKNFTSVKQWGDIEWKTFEAAFFRDKDRINTPLVINSQDNPNLSDVLSMKAAFSRSFFSPEENDSIAFWDVSGIKDMSYMFFGSLLFTENLGGITLWDVSKVENMSYMFASTFGPTGIPYSLNSWDVSSVKDMKYMFSVQVSFSGGIDSWDVSSVENMSHMFYEAYQFKGDLSSWDVSNVKDMSSMFEKANSFIGDLSSWDVSKVEDMSYMFSYGSLFNGDLSNWDVSSVEKMNYMFYNRPAYYGDISSWNVSSVEEMELMFSMLVVSSFVYDSMLENWSKLDLKEDLDLGVVLSHYGIRGEYGYKAIFGEEGMGWKMQGYGHHPLELDTSPSIGHSGSLKEKESNNGSLKGKIHIGLAETPLLLDNQNYFINKGGELTSGTHYTVSNLPAGLTPKVKVSESGKTIELTLEGRAESHREENSVTNFTFELNNSAFENDASNVENKKIEDIKINFKTEFRVRDQNGKLITIEEGETTSSSGDVLYLDDSIQQLMIRNNADPLIVQIENSATDPIFNLSSLNDNIIPEMEIHTGNLDVYIQQGAFSTDLPGWDKSMMAPRVTSFLFNDGEDYTTIKAIETGISGSRMTFEKAIKIVLKGEAGNKVGFVEGDGKLKEITNVCESNDQTWANSNLPAGGECKIESGSDMIVWTKHFTKFVTYTKSEPVKESSSRVIGYRDPSLVFTQQETEEKIQELIFYNLGLDTLRLGQNNIYVKDLQKFLNNNLNAGLDEDGIFGRKTFEAVILYQKNNNLTPDGVVGPLTKEKILR